MPAPRSQHASLIDALQLVVQDERQSGDLTRLPSTVILAAMTTRDEIAETIRANPTSASFETFDTITDHLGTLATFRLKKIIQCVGYGQPANMLPQEVAFFNAVQSATNELMGAWGVE